MNFLIATNNAAFLSEASSIIKNGLPQIKKIEDTLDSSDLLHKISNKNFAYILIDLNTCPINPSFFSKLTKIKNTKIKIASQNYADIPIEFFDQKSIQLISFNNAQLAQELKKFILNDKDYFWGEDIKQFSLYEKEILCHDGSIGDAIYLIKDGLLQREFPDGSVLDGAIEPGRMVGELAYFFRAPRSWKVVAAKDTTLIRISYQKVDKQLESQPGWIKVMFSSLAERSLKYAKSH